MTLPLNKSILTAIGIAVAIFLWMFSGNFKEEAEKTEAKPTPTVTAQKSKAVKVQVKTMEATDHAKVIRLFGQTQADRSVEIKTQTEGLITDILIEKGAMVKKGDVIAKIAMDDRGRKLRSAQASLRQRQLEYEANRKLSKKSYRSQTKLAESEALLNAARAELEKINIDIRNTSIKAPFDGKLEDRTIEIGDFVDNGTAVAKVVDLSPIVITADVAEADITKISDGQTAQAILYDGRTLDAIVRYVASSSNASTRTYRVELESENPDNVIPAGQTAQVRLTVGTKSAYLLSPAIMTLSDEGAIGVKTVNTDNMVEFHQVSLVEDTVNGVWVAGLPDKTRVITRGQEYVKMGQQVVAIESETTSSDTSEPALAKAQGN